MRGHLIRLSSRQAAVALAAVLLLSAPARAEDKPKCTIVVGASEHGKYVLDFITANNSVIDASGVDLDTLPYSIVGRGDCAGVGIVLSGQHASKSPRLQGEQ